MNRVLTKGLWVLIIGLLLAPTWANAQSGATGTAPINDQELRSRIYYELDSLRALDTIPDDAILPITRDQAEDLIAKIIVEARAPYLEQRLQDEALHKFKVETLKERLLDQALRDSYLDPYKERMDRLERLVYALLLSKGDIDPSVINHLLSGGTPGDQYIQPYAGIMPPQQHNPSLLAQPGQEVPADAQRVVPRALDPEEAIAISPDAPADKIEYFMSQIFFAFDSSALTDEAKETLDNVAAWMKLNSYSVSLRGYASLEGNIRYNNRLSGRRVEAVADYLKGKGIEVKRIEEIPSGIDSIKEEKSDFPDARRVDIRPILYVGYY